jgi:hypothetical protein
MGILKRRAKTDDRPMTAEELNQRSKIDGIRYRELQLIKVLVDNGCDLAVPRETTFFIYIPKKKDAEASAEVLRGHGFETKIWNPHEKNPDWTVVAERRDRALIPDFLRETVDLCEQLAADYGGVFDGWEAGPDLAPSSM